jgi:hypothetical protein
LSVVNEAIPKAWKKPRKAVRAFLKLVEAVEELIKPVNVFYTYHILINNIIRTTYVAVFIVVKMRAIVEAK